MSQENENGEDKIMYLENLISLKKSYERLIAFHKNYYVTLSAQQVVKPEIDNYIKASLTYYSNMLTMLIAQIENAVKEMHSDSESMN